MNDLDTSIVHYKVIYYSQRKPIYEKDGPTFADIITETYLTSIHPGFENDL